MSGWPPARPHDPRAREPQPPEGRPVGSIATDPGATPPGGQPREHEVPKWLGTERLGGQDAPAGAPADTTVVGSAGGSGEGGGTTTTVLAAPSPSTSPWRRRVLAAGLAVALAVGGGAAGAWIADRDEPPAAAPVVAPAGSTGSPGGSATDVEQATQRLLDVVVDVSTSGLGGTGGGSGVIMRPDGYIVTNNHVVEGAQAVTVTLPSGERLDAEVVGTDAAHDIAVLKADRTGLPAATFGRSSEVQVGQPVIAVGSPFGLSGTVTTGIVSALDRVVNAAGGRGGSVEQIVGALQTDAAINPGNSGGALATTSGQVIGINTAIASGSGSSSGVGFAIPSDTALEVANSLIAGRPVQVPYLGVGGSEQPAGQQQPGQFGTEDRAGALVQQVEPGSPADRAGLEVGDLVVELNNQPIHNWDELIAATRRTTIGQEVEVVVVRDGREQTLTVTSSARPT
jgi:putative serine protease PepD